MRKIVLSAMFMIVGLLFVAQTNAQSVSGSLNTPRKGRVSYGYVVLNIPKGLHVNSNNPRSKYAVATAVTVSGSGVRTYGITYPTGRMRKFEFSNDPISVYEGRTVIRFKVSVPKNYRGKTVTLKARVRYQACTEEVCYAPKTETLNITASIK
ncbi:MAG: protein-disulfide reductase DsbD domain-containing protein [Pyrinomonadaceae bacterium]